MQGIQYVTDTHGKRIAVQIDLRKYGELWEDFYDGLKFLTCRASKCDSVLTYWH